MQPQMSFEHLLVELFQPLTNAGGILIIPTTSPNLQPWTTQDEKALLGRVRKHHEDTRPALGEAIKIRHDMKDRKRRIFDVRVLRLQPSIGSSSRCLSWVHLWVGFFVGICLQLLLCAVW